MRIKKAKLKQIIQEELQKLSEQGPIARMKARKARGDRQEIDPETGKIVYQTTDMARPAQDMTSDYGAPGQSEFDRDTEYDKQMDADVDSQVASGGIEFDDSIRPGGDTDPTVTSSTMVDDILSGKPEGAEGAFGDAGDAAPAPVRRVASDQMRKNINKAWKSGKIDKNTWRKARRALYKSADSAAAILAAAGVDANTGGALAAAKPAQAKSAVAKPAVGAPAGATATSGLSAGASAEIARLTTGFGELSSGGVPSDPKIRKRFTDMASRLVDGGMPRRSAVERARGTIGSLLQNKIAKLKLAPDKARMLAKRAERSKKARGRELEAIAGDTGTGLPFGRPGQFEESLDRLTKIVEEEFDKVLAEKDEGEKKKRKTALQRAQERYDKHKAAHDKEKTNKNRTRMLTAKRALEVLKRAAAGTGKPGDN